MTMAVEFDWHAIYLYTVWAFRSQYLSMIDDRMRFFISSRSFRRICDPDMGNIRYETCSIKNRETTMVTSWLLIKLAHCSLPIAQQRARPAPVPGPRHLGGWQPIIRTFSSFIHWLIYLFIYEYLVVKFLINVFIHLCVHLHIHLRSSRHSFI